MLRKLLALLLALTMPLCAAADETAPYEMDTFAACLPDMLREPLSALIPDESRILSGASIRHNGGHFGDEPEFLDAISALVLVGTEDGPRLYAAAWVEKLPWQVNDYTRFLRSDGDISVSIYQPGDSHVPMLSVDYAVPGGLVSDLLCFWSNRLWCFSGHIDAAEGVSVRSSMGVLTVTDRQGEEQYVCGNPFCLDYMTGAADFPVSRDQAQAIALRDDVPFPAAGSVVYAAGANLRREPTASSESLGRYAYNTPMVFTGETRLGTAWPWYQVRIGETLGWMSSNYILHEPDFGFGPVLLGRTPGGCLMYNAPDDERASAQLTAGVTFHILAEYEGMYHICIPGEVSWAVATDGVCGYIVKEGILTGASPSALDALENSQ